MPPILQTPNSPAKLYKSSNINNDQKNKVKKIEYFDSDTVKTDNSNHTKTTTNGTWTKIANSKAGNFLGTTFAYLAVPILAVPIFIINGISTTLCKAALDYKATEKKQKNLMTSMANGIKQTFTLEKNWLGERGELWNKIGVSRYNNALKKAKHMNDPSLAKYAFAKFGIFKIFAYTYLDAQRIFETFKDHVEDSENEELNWNNVKDNFI